MNAVRAPIVEASFAPVPEVPPARALLQMLMANRLQQAIYVAARLAVADELGDGPRTTEELAQKTGAHPGALRRLLRVLASFGIFAEDADGRISLTPLAALLRSDHPASLRSVALWAGGMAYKVFGDLEYSVRSGQPAFDHVFGMEFFQYLGQNPDSAREFDEFMARQTGPVAPSVLAAYRLDDVGTIVDLAGGRGEFLARALLAYPGAEGVLFDRPHVLEGARVHLARAGVADRCRLLAGDVLEAVPSGGDVYILKSLLHGVADEPAICILTNCRRAMADSARLLLIELLISPGNGPSPAKLMDLLMLVGSHGGRERTELEFRRLLEGAGLQLTRVVPTDSAYSVLECLPA